MSISETFDDVKAWCEEHKTELIIGGISVATIVGAVIIGKKLYKSHKAAKTLEKALDEANYICSPKLPMAEHASIVMRDDWLDPTFGKEGLTLIQSFPNVSYDLMPKVDVRKCLESTPDAITEAMIEGFGKLLENVDPETIKSVNILYDIA